MPRKVRAPGPAALGAPGRRWREAGEVTARRSPGDGFEAADEVGLVEVAELQGETRQVLGVGAAQLFGRLVQAVAGNHPLGAHPDALQEMALQTADVDTGQRRGLLHPGDGRVHRQPLHQVPERRGAWRQDREPRCQEGLGELDAPPHVRLQENGLRQPVALVSEDRRQALDAVAEPRQRSSVERMERRGTEFHPEDARPSAEASPENPWSRGRPPVRDRARRGGGRKDGATSPRGRRGGPASPSAPSRSVPRRERARPKAENARARCLPPRWTARGFREASRRAWCSNGASKARRLSCFYKTGPAREDYGLHPMGRRAGVGSV